MILTATPAPAIDQTVRLNELRLGESLRVDPAVIRPGGKGINVARVLASRGHPVRALTTRGGDDGALLAASLEHCEVELRWLPVSAPTRRSTAWVEASGRTTVLNERAGAWSGAEFDAWLEALGTAATGVSAAALCGSWPEGVPAAWVGRSVEALVGSGAYTVVDTSGPFLLTAAAAGASLLKPNVEELAQATGTPDVNAGVDLLFELGAREVLLSRGPEGLSHYTREDRSGLHARLDEALSGNPTGAGDAAVAGWLSVVSSLGAASSGGLSSGAAPRGSAPVGNAPSGRTPQGSERERAMRTAVAWSASAVLAPVAGELTPDAEHFMDRVRVDG